jgi:hypothetical protein
MQQLCKAVCESFELCIIFPSKSTMMKKFPLLFIFFSITFFNDSFGQITSPDTVKVGVYVTSIHDIDFKQKEYALQLWLWLKYKNKEFDFEKNLEIPMAKSV